MIQILDGLSYLHSKGIIHRASGRFFWDYLLIQVQDIKADNILLRQSGICQISDFALVSRNFAPQTSSHPGTFWLAPEVLEPGDQDSKVDIWAVGCVALEMWTGNRPWHGEEISNVMIMLGQRGIPPVPEDVELPALAEGFRRQCFVVWVPFLPISPIDSVETETQMSDLPPANYEATGT